jgi:hypothetical protein
MISENFRIITEYMLFSNLINPVFISDFSRQDVLQPSKYVRALKLIAYVYVRDWIKGHKDPFGTPKWG